MHMDDSVEINCLIAVHGKPHTSSEHIDKGFPLQVFRKCLSREVVPGIRLCFGTEIVLSISQFSGTVVGGTEVPPRVKARHAIDTRGVFTTCMSVGYYRK